MLGVAQVRSATIYAETICSMWEIAQEEALPIINRHPDAQEYFVSVIVDHLERTVPQRISSLSLFRGFDRKFRTLLSIYCERAAYFPEQQIVQEGQAGEKLYVVNFGRARLEKKGVQVKLYNSGTCFGCSVMLGIHKVYIGTLIALQTCHFVSISRHSYAVALEQYPSHAAAQALKRTEKVAAEALKEAVVRTATRKLILARYRSVMQAASGAEALVTPGVPHMTEPEILERYLHAWSQRVKYCKRRRVQMQIAENQRRIMMEAWMKKRADAKKHADKLRKMKTKDWEDLGDEAEPVKLPPISTNATNMHEIACVIKDWPTPRPSPHYKLRVYSVLHSVGRSPTEAATVLPVLRSASRALPQETQRLEGYWFYAGNDGIQRKYELIVEDAEHITFKQESVSAEGTLRLIDGWWEGNVKIGNMRLRCDGRGDHVRLVSQFKNHVHDKWGPGVVASKNAFKEDGAHHIIIDRDD